MEKLVENHRLHAAKKKKTKKQMSENIKCKDNKTFKNN
jgi:hypothetical protein